MRGGSVLSSPFPFPPPSPPPLLRYLRSSIRRSVMDLIAGEPRQPQKSYPVNFLNESDEVDKKFIHNFGNNKSQSNRCIVLRFRVEKLRLLRVELVQSTDLTLYKNDKFFISLLLKFKDTIITNNKKIFWDKTIFCSYLLLKNLFHRPSHLKYILCILILQ